MKKLITAGLVAAATLGLTALPATAAGTYTLTSTCNATGATVTASLAGYGPGSYANLWSKVKTFNYSIAPQAVVHDGETVTRAIPRSTSFYNQVTLRYEIHPTDGTAVFTVGGPAARC